VKPYEPYRRYPYHRSADQDGAEVVRHPVVVVGAGPVGLAMAVDLALRDVPVVVLDAKAQIGEGSRGICFSKRTLEILDRLGVGERALAKGVTWSRGKLFHRERQLFAFDLQPEIGHKMPAFINIQQYYLEGFLYDRAKDLAGLDLRFQHRASAVEAADDHVRLTVATPDGPYQLEAEWLIACDGPRSTVRSCLGLDFEGKVFHDHFLIVDVTMHADFPTERWFWFDPPFNPGQSALLHRQPDDVWRIDLQLGPDADPKAERQLERVMPRLEAMLGHRDFEIEWVSVYTFQCRRLGSFVHGRVIFAGDAAHQVSPFGARGFNGGVQDTDNLAWKLALLRQGAAPPALIESYRQEREAAADENILHSTRATDFITPKSGVSRTFRDATLELASVAPFGRALINSGRLSTPCTYRDSPLSTPDPDPFGGSARLGAPLPDAPMHRPDGGDGWLLNALGSDFTLLHQGDEHPDPLPEGVTLVQIGRDLIDEQGVFAERYDGTPGSWWLVRPDQHLAARGRAFDREALNTALRRARGWEISDG
jgi:3-(3-hydroxy-phenyl)propionate hydroxylase